MRKYYVSGNDSQYLIMAHTDVQAALNVLKKMLLKVTEGYCDTIVLPKDFRVSQRGFNEHDDDQVYDLDLLLHLVRLDAEFDGVV